MIETNESKLIENIEREVNKSLVDINHANLLDGFQQPSAENFYEIYLTNQWVDEIYNFINSKVRRIGKSAVQDDYSPFNESTFFLLWKIPICLSTSTGVSTNKHEPMSLTGSSNSVTQLFGKTIFANFSKIDDTFLIEQVKSMEKNIIKNLKNCNKNLANNYWHHLSLFLMRTCCCCLYYGYEQGSKPEHNLSYEFTRRVIEPITHFLQFVFNVNLDFIQQESLSLNEETLESQNFEPVRLTKLKELRAGTKLKPDTIVSLRTTGTGNDSNTKDNTLVIIEHKLPPLISKVNSPEDLSKIESILLQILSYKVCVNSLNWGIINDLYGSLLVKFDPEDFKNTSDDGSMILKGVQVFKVNDVEFFPQVGKEKHFNSRILVSMMIYLEIRKYVNIGRDGEPEEPLELEMKSESALEAKVTGIKEGSYRKPLKVLINLNKKDEVKTSKNKRPLDSGANTVAKRTRGLIKLGKSDLDN